MLIDHIRRATGFTLLGDTMDQCCKSRCDHQLCKLTWCVHDPLITMLLLRLHVNGSFAKDISRQLVHWAFSLTHDSLRKNVLASHSCSFHSFSSHPVLSPSRSHLLFRPYVFPQLILISSRSSYFQLHPHIFFTFSSLIRHSPPDNSPIVSSPHPHPFLILLSSCLHPSSLYS